MGQAERSVSIMLQPLSNVVKPPIAVMVIALVHSLFIFFMCAGRKIFRWKMEFPKKFGEKSGSGRAGCPAALRKRFTGVLRLDRA